MHFDKHVDTVASNGIMGAILWMINEAEHVVKTGATGRWV